MLKALRNIDPKEAQLLLSEVTLSLLPDPGIELPHRDRAARMDLEAQVLAEAQTRLKIDPTDDSPQTRARLLVFLTEEMRHRVLRGADLQAIKARIGQYGDLRPDLYDIRIPMATADELSHFGIRSSHVEEVLRSPDEVQHLLSQRFSGPDGQALSLYIKVIGNPGNADAFTLLVQTQRNGATLNVEKAWRIYHSDVDLRQAGSPLDVLRAFVEVYGIPFRVGQSLPAKFFLYEVFPPLPDQLSMDVVSFDLQDPRLFEASWLFRRSVLGVIEVAIAYAVDWPKYQADLQKHGVRTSPLPLPK